ncbi:hypothetical protein BC739_000256 [Kutzneria viridogrisea]|uniref:Uncharacterized protein n=1 Tax=Kutzneria viridogrisea TaxID=47990 RepID=A0ABR6B862_9PSEU|nr:hypothetical protein [Kutzneria albida]MBA8923059.1 hypothetical protein [Kutzneria viridogrisea]
MTQIEIVLEADGNLAAATSSLLRELHGGARVDARPVSTPAEPGAKSDTATTIGALVVAGLTTPSAIRALVSVLLAFVKRGSARSIELRSGQDRLRIDGAGARTERQVVETWLREHSAGRE